VCLCAERLFNLLGASQAGRVCFFRAMLQLLLYQFSLTYPLVQNSTVTSPHPHAHRVGYPLFLKKRTAP